MVTASAELNPRKSPLQARALATREALHGAAIQVLTREGLAGSGMTSVNERLAWRYATKKFDPTRSVTSPAK